METITQERIEELAEKIGNVIDLNEEYETTHDDAGANYAHMIREGDWQYYNGTERLLQYCELHDIPTNPKAVEAMEEYCLDWSDCKPHDGYGRACSELEFEVATFEVGEIEVCLNIFDMTKWADCTEEEAEAALEYMKDERDYCLSNSFGNWYAYVLTDAYWVFFVDLATLREIANDNPEDADQ